MHPLLDNLPIVHLCESWRSVILAEEEAAVVKSIACCGDVLHLASTC
jgi:hypothetical protein